MIGIVGHGFVGHAVACSYLPEQVKIYDIDRSKRGGSASCNNYKDSFVDALEELDGCSAIFVCVPTPQGKDGNTISLILDICVEECLKLTPLILAKSTAPVSVYNRYPRNVVHVPEFLRAATSVADYLEQHRIVVGIEGYGKSDTSDLQGQVYETFNQSSLKAYLSWMPRADASFVKYAHNVSLAVKVAVMNELYVAASDLGISWDNIVDGLNGTAAGHSHTRVPGPDGKTGIGGACFPKDLSSMIFELRKMGHETELFDAAARWIRPRPDL